MTTANNRLEKALMLAGYKCGVCGKPAYRKGCCIQCWNRMIESQDYSFEELDSMHPVHPTVVEATVKLRLKQVTELTRDPFAEACGGKRALRVMGRGAFSVDGAPLSIPDGFTCDKCEARFTCDYAFDPYNTDGDCLASK